MQGSSERELRKLLRLLLTGVRTAILGTQTRADTMEMGAPYPAGFGTAVFRGDPEQDAGGAEAEQT